MRTSRQYFERIYGQSQDPWGFATRLYEQRKYALTLASLPDQRYGAAFEPGCSIGVLSEQLATRCDRLLAVDHMAGAVETATHRLRSFPHVHVERRTIPEEWPAGPFDLVVLSEVGYYFDHEGLQELVEKATSSLAAGATVIGVHWRGETDYPLSGDETHAVLGATPSFVPVVHHAEDCFLLDVWRIGSRAHP